MSENRSCYFCSNSVCMDGMKAGEWVCNLGLDYRADNCPEFSPCIMSETKEKSKEKN